MSREGAQGWGPAVGQAVGPGCVPGRGRVWVGGARAAGVGSAAPGRRGRDGPGRRAQSVLARTWREARPGWGLPTGAESLDALFVRPPLTLRSSRRGRAGGRSSLSPSPGRTGLSPPGLRRLEVPPPAGRAGERFFGPGVIFTQLSGAPARGRSGGGSPANSASSASWDLAPTPAPAPGSTGGRPSAAVAVA